jgi:hypothetical protein
VRKLPVHHSDQLTKLLNSKRSSPAWGRGQRIERVTLRQRPTPIPVAGRPEVRKQLRSCSAPVPWATPRRPKKVFEELVTVASRPETSRLFPPSEDGGKRSRCGSSPAPRQAGSRRRTSRSRTLPETAATLPIADRLSLGKCHTDGGNTLIKGSTYRKPEEPASADGIPIVPIWHNVDCSAAT